MKLNIHWQAPNELLLQLTGTGVCPHTTTTTLRFWFWFLRSSNLFLLYIGKLWNVIKIYLLSVELCLKTLQSQPIWCPIYILVVTFHSFCFIGLFHFRILIKGGGNGVLDCLGSFDGTFKGFGRNFSRLVWIVEDLSYYPHFHSETWPAQ